MREFARDFYHSKKWHDVSVAYMMSQSYICERCGKPATICHHKRYLSPANISDPTISLNFENLEALCHDCHNKEHMTKYSKAIFSSCGDMVGVKKSQSEKSFEADRKKIDELLEKMTAQNGSKID